MSVSRQQQTSIERAALDLTPAPAVVHAPAPADAFHPTKTEAEASAAYFALSDAPPYTRAALTIVDQEIHQLLRDAKRFDEKVKELCAEVPQLLSSPARIDEAEHFANCSRQIAERLRGRADQLRENEAAAKTAGTSLPSLHDQRAAWALALLAAHWPPLFPESDARHV